MKIISKYIHIASKLVAKSRTAPSSYVISTRKRQILPELLRAIFSPPLNLETAFCDLVRLVFQDRISSPSSFMIISNSGLALKNPARAVPIVLYVNAASSSLIFKV